MAKILVVDDRAVNREFLAELLGYAGHQVFEAADGVEALEMLRREKPDLTICDVLMPRMDGYEFVRQVRSDEELRTSSIIFYTATYHGREAKILAEATGIRHIISKPAEPEEILRVVAEALSDGSVSGLGISDERYHIEHAQLLSRTLISRMEELEIASGKLAALIDLSLDFAAEHDAERLLRRFAVATRQLVPSRLAVAAVLDAKRDGISWFAADGIAADTILPAVSPRQGLLGLMLASKKPSCVNRVGGDPAAVGFASGHPPVHSFLGMPLFTGADAFGWTYLVDRADVDGFTAEDEKVFATLAAMLAVHFTNLRLRAEVHGHVVHLEREVAERRRTETELRASEQRTRLATETAAIGIWEWNVRTNLVQWDAEMFRIYGIPPTESGVVEYSDWKTAVVPEDLSGQEAVLQETVRGRGGSTREFRIRRRSDGAMRIIQAIETVRLTEQGVEWVVGTNRDVTEAREAEQEILRLVKQNQLILDAAGEGIYGVDNEGRVTFINPAAARMLAAVPSELLGQSAHERFHHTRPNGTPFPRDECRIYTAFHDGKTHRVEEEFFWRTDGTSFPVEYSSVPIRDHDGKLLGAVVTFNDITERLRRQEELEQERRISALGRIAATIGHEFNNVLMGISPFAELLKKKPEDAAAVRRAAESIHGSIQRGAKITREILRFTRPADPSFEVVNFGRWLEGISDEIENLVGPQIALRVDISADHAEVFCDPGQLAQVLTNLATNARDAMQGSGRLEIRAGADESSVILQVRDTGCGIPSGIIDQIFEPLFTRKRNGTGLGLAVTKQVIRKHGGTISVASRIGEGTTFTIELPRWKGRGEARERLSQSE